MGWAAAEATARVATTLESSTIPRSLRPTTGSPDLGRWYKTDPRGGRSERGRRPAGEVGAGRARQGVRPWRASLARALPDELQPELVGSLDRCRRAGPGDHPEVLRGHVGRHAAELRVVEGVERLEPELQARALREVEVLEEREVQVAEAGSAQDVALGVAELAEAGWANAAVLNQRDRRVPPPALGSPMRLARFAFRSCRGRPPTSTAAWMVMREAGLPECRCRSAASRR